MSRTDLCKMFCYISVKLGSFPFVEAAQWSFTQRHIQHHIPSHEGWFLEGLKNAMQCNPVNVRLQSSRGNTAKSVQCLLPFQTMHEYEGNNYNGGLSSRVCVFTSAKCMNSPPDTPEMCRTVTVIWGNGTRTGCTAA